MELGDMCPRCWEEEVVPCKPLCVECLVWFADWCKRYKYPNPYAPPAPTPPPMPDIVDPNLGRKSFFRGKK